MKRLVFAFALLFAQSVFAGQIPDSTPIADLFKAQRDGKLVLAFRVKPSAQIQKALNSYNLFLEMRMQGKPITSSVLLEARQNPKFKFIIVDGKLVSITELIDGPTYDGYSTVSINVSPGIPAKELVQIPKVLAGSTLVVKQMTFESRIARENLVFVLENTPVTLSMHGWLRATVGDLRNALKNAADVLVELR